MEACNELLDKEDLWFGTDNRDDSDVAVDLRPLDDDGNVWWPPSTWCHTGWPCPAENVTKNVLATDAGWK